MSAGYRTLGRQLVCSNSRFDVFFDAVELPDGKLLPDYLTVRPRVQDPQGISGVFVLPEVDGKIGLMKAFRHQFACDIWQAPGGFIEPGERIAAAAVRELLEETGLNCEPATLIPLGSLCTDAGLVEGRVAIFLARCKASRNGAAASEEIGTGELQFFSPEELERLLDRDKNVGSATMVAGYRYLNLLKCRTQTLAAE